MGFSSVGVGGWLEEAHERWGAVRSKKGRAFWRALGRGNQGNATHLQPLVCVSVRGVRVQLLISQAKQAPSTSPKPLLFFIQPTHPPTHPLQNRPQQKHTTHHKPHPTTVTAASTPSSISKAMVSSSIHPTPNQPQPQPTHPTHPPTNPKKQPTDDTLRPYLAALEAALHTALCLRNLPSQNVERHNKPEIETRLNKELLLPPVTITRNEKEKVLIEPSINSVRISILLKQADEMEEILCRTFTRFLMQRAEQFIVLRRKAIEGYSISFLITHAHLERMRKQQLVDFIVSFVEDIDREISGMRLALNARYRLVASEYLRGFAGC